MSNKDLILQEIFSYEAIFRISKMLDQLAEGLQTLGMLKMMRLFPQKFIQLFTYKQLSPVDVVECLCCTPQLPGEEIAIKHLKKFLMTSSEEGNHFKPLHSSVVNSHLFQSLESF